MKHDIPRERMKRLLRLSPEERRNFIAKCRPEEHLVWDAMFETWAENGQLEKPEEGWRVWLMMAGRGFGKTRAGAEWIFRLACGRRKNIALVGATIDEARAVMVEGVSGILRVARRHRCPITWEPSKGKLTWRSGSVAQLYSGDNADGLRGPEHGFAWADELAKWRQAEEAWNNLQMGLRAGPRPRALVTTTPRPLRMLERIRSDPWTVESGGRMADNINLPKQFVSVMEATYGKTRLGRQELDGELIADVEGSLWPRGLIERCRLDPSTIRSSADGSPPHASHREEYDRVVVGVDPPAGAGDGADACGIVVAAKAGEQFFVLADESVQGLSPDGWARAVAAAAARWRADRVVAEANNGGAMISSCLMNAGAGVKPKLVHASRGKVARAEPIAVLFESGRGWFAGTFPELEDELAGLQIGGGYQGPSRSPDRADAMVWAMTELVENRVRVPRVVRL